MLPRTVKAERSLILHDLPPGVAGDRENYGTSRSGGFFAQTVAKGMLSTPTQYLSLYSLHLTDCSHLLISATLGPSRGTVVLARLQRLLFTPIPWTDRPVLPSKPFRLSRFRLGHFLGISRRIYY